MLLPPDRQSGMMQISRSCLLEFISMDTELCSTDLNRCYYNHYSESHMKSNGKSLTGVLTFKPCCTKCTYQNAKNVGPTLLEENIRFMYSALHNYAHL